MPELRLLPNLHLLVVHCSAVLLLAGTTFLIAGKLLATRRFADSLLHAGRWNVWVGAPLAVLALVTGWLVLAGARLDPFAQATAELHVRAGALGSLLAIGAMVLSRQPTRVPGWIVLAVLIVGSGAMTLSALAGSQLIHRHGLGIEREREEPRMPVAMLRTPVSDGTAALRSRWPAGLTSPGWGPALET